MTLPEYIDYSELEFPEGCDDLDWADVPGGYLNWVDYWMARFEEERDANQETQAQIAAIHRVINFAKLDVTTGGLMKRVISMLHRLRNLSQICDEQRTYIRKLEDVRYDLADKKKVS